MKQSVVGWLAAQLAVMEKRCKEAVVAREHLADKMTELERERKASDKRNGEMLLRIGKLGSELEEEKEVGEGLLLHTWTDVPPSAEQVFDWQPTAMEGALGGSGAQVAFHSGA